MAALPANAEPQINSGVFCDTREQVTRFLTLWDGTNSEAARVQVNEEVKKAGACIKAQVIVETVATLETVAAHDRSWQLVEVKIYAVFIRPGVAQRFPVPLTQYSAILASPPPTLGRMI